MMSLLLGGSLLLAGLSMDQSRWARQCGESWPITTTRSCAANFGLRASPRNTAGIRGYSGTSHANSPRALRAIERARQPQRGSVRSLGLQHPAGVQYRRRIPRDTPPRLASAIAYGVPELAN